MNIILSTIAIEEGCSKESRSKLKKARPRISKLERIATPDPFRDELILMIRGAR